MPGTEQRLKATKMSAFWSPISNESWFPKQFGRKLNTIAPQLCLQRPLCTDMRESMCRGKRRVLSFEKDGQIQHAG